MSKRSSSPSYSPSRKKRHVNKGECLLCGKIGMKSTILKHMPSHFKEDEKAEGKSFIILMEGYQSWLMIQVRDDVKGSEFKKYIKNWIDCGCGHLEEWNGPGGAGPIGKELSEFGWVL